MSTAFTDSVADWDALLRAWRELDVPEGWRPEVTVEGIHVSPPPGGPHNLIAGRVHRGLLAALPDDCEVFQTLGVAIREAGGIHVPDLCVVPRARVPRNADPVSAEHVLLVVAITSPGNADRDRKRKKWTYAHGGIPQYLLIDAYDREGATVSLFSDPVAGVFREVCRVPFGQPVKLGAPFDLELDTSEF